MSMSVPPVAIHLALGVFTTNSYYAPPSWFRSYAEATVFDRLVRVPPARAQAHITVLICGAEGEHQVVFNGSDLAQVLAWYARERDENPLFSATFSALDAALVKSPYLHYAVPFSADGATRFS